MSLIKFGNSLVTKNNFAIDRQLHLPPYTIRFDFNGQTPTWLMPVITKGTWTEVSTGIWDWHYESHDWSDIFYGAQIKGSILGINATAVHSLGLMFEFCRDLYKVANFKLDPGIDGYVNVQGMFSYNNSLTEIPNIDFSDVVRANVTRMFEGCTNVQTGALALYRQMINSPTSYSDHSGTFHYCGIKTESGRLELAQIPSDWK